MIIGKRIAITAAKNATLEGRRGTVVDETKHTLTLQLTGKRITVIKDQITTIEENP